MSARTINRQTRRRRRTITYAWIVALAIITISLIYWEMIALLYVLATLGVTILLVVVAVSDLAHAERVTPQIAAADQPASLGSGAPSASVKAPSDWGARKRT
jgi:Flp pilus assembly protein TadB